MREVIRSLVKILLRCHSTVRRLMNNLAAISALDSPLRGEPGYLGLLCGALARRFVAAHPDGLAGCQQFAGSPIGKRLHPHRGERVVGCAELNL